MLSIRNKGEKVFLVNSLAYFYKIFNLHNNVHKVKKLTYAVCSGVGRIWHSKRIYIIIINLKEIYTF